MTSKPKFRRPERKHRSTKNTEDTKGTVKVIVARIVPGSGGLYVKGNIIRTATIADAKVSEVFKTVDAALFS